MSQNHEDEIIVIHVGAGKHSKENTSKYKKLMKCALCVPSDDDKVSKLCAVGSVLEQSELTNTGYGSSLNIDGEVQCDSSFILHDLSSNKKKIGGLYNIRALYPIKETIEYYNNLYKSKMGLSSPVLVDFEAISGNKLENDHIISARASAIYQLYRERVRGDYSMEEVSDTIGVIISTTTTNHLATSSGGNFFKKRGRIGCAGIIGSAIYSDSNGALSVSVSCSGNGEDIIRMDLARYLTQNLLLESDEWVDYGNKLKLLISAKAGEFDLCAVDQYNEPIIYVGVVCLIHHKLSNRHILAYCHTTESFYCAFKRASRIEFILSKNGCAGKFLIGEYNV